MKKLFFILHSTFFLNINVFSQDQGLIDSLTIELKKLERERIELREGALSIRDSSTAKVLIALCRACMHNNYDKAEDYGKQALTLSEQIKWKKGVATSYNQIGNVCWNQSKYQEALKNHLTSLKIAEELGDKSGMADAHNNIGSVYSTWGNYPDALKNYLASLKISEEIGDKSGIAAGYNNIGNIYLALSNYPEALKKYFAALKMNEAAGNKNWLANNYGNIGMVYSTQGNYPEALKNFAAALKIFEEIGIKSGIGGSYLLIGGVYSKQGNYQDALKNYLAALKIFEAAGAKRGIVACYNAIGLVCTKLNRAKEGKEWLQKGLALSRELGTKAFIRNAYAGIASADSALGNYKGAFENHKLYIRYRDSILNEENTKKITQQQMQYEFDKKDALTKAEQEKKDAVALEEIENQKLIRNGFIGGFATVLLFAGTFFVQRNKIRRGKKRSDELLLNILPEEVAEELKETGSSKAKSFSMVSVMFTDFKDFTKISETVSAEMLVDELHSCFSAFDTILHKHNIEKIKTIGDAYMCVSGLPVPNESHATDMVNASLEILDYIAARKKEKDARNEFSFELRIGINSGPVIAGIVGLKKFSYDIWGDTVNTAARMEHQGESGKINISGTTYELVKDNFTCKHRGKITAKNKGEIDMYFVETRNSNTQDIQPG